MPTLARSQIFSSIPNQGTTVETLEEAIEKAVLVVCETHQACSDGQNQQAFVVDIYRQAEDVQLHERGTTEETLEEVIEKRVLVVCEFHKAYLHYQLDYADYSSHLRHPI